MSLLNTVVYQKLDGEYTAKIKSYKEVEHAKGNRIDIVLDLPEGREYTYCVFENQVDYVSSCLRDQLGVDKKIILKDLLDLATKQEFKVWFSYNYDYNRMNVALHQPTVVETEEAITEM